MSTKQAPKTKFVGGYSRKQAASDAKAIKAEWAGKNTGHFTKVVLPAPASPAEIKAARKALHVSQTGFATLVGVSPPSVKAWERGARRPDGVTSRLIRLLKANPAFMQVWTSV